MNCALNTREVRGQGSNESKEKKKRTSQKERCVLNIYVKYILTKDDVPAAMP